LFLGDAKALKVIKSGSVAAPKVCIESLIVDFVQQKFV
jgi:hypothetical protein